MGYSNVHTSSAASANEDAGNELLGRWVAVDRRANTELRHLPFGGVLVDYDTELDRLCQRVADAGLKSLTIFRYQGQRVAA
jgi:hypothetical protein